jgi:transmembrane sensor
MSDTNTNVQTAPSTDVEMRAAAWLRRQQFYDWSDDDQTGFDAWLAESNSHAAAYWRLKAAWSKTERLAALRRPAPDSAEPERNKRNWPLIGGIVAGFVFFLIVGMAPFVLQQRAWQTYATPLGGHKTVTLADGSRIDINTDTVLRTNFGGGRRVVDVVQGEAYFHVRHDASVPFVVTAAGHRIVDLGTTFLVRTSAGALEVALISGRARLESPDNSIGQHSKILMPGDVAVATDRSLNVSRKMASQLTDEIAWRRGMLVFHNTSLADAADQFNRYNVVKLMVPDNRAAAMTINGTFRTDGVEQFARVTRDVFGLHVEDRGSDIVIGR